MYNNVEKSLKSILGGMVLESKQQTMTTYHGSQKDDVIEYTSYYDVHRGIWTTYEKAVEGYVLSKLKPMLNELIKEI